MIHNDQMLIKYIKDITIRVTHGFNNNIIISILGQAKNCLFISVICAPKPREFNLDASTVLYIPGLLFEGSKIKLVIITEVNIAYLATDY